MKPHKWAKEIKAWADGAEIEFKTPLGEWEDCDIKPDWRHDVEYRIKTQPKDFMEILIGENQTLRLHKNAYNQYTLSLTMGEVIELQNAIIKPQPKEPQYLYVYQQGFDYKFSSEKKTEMQFSAGFAMCKYYYKGKIKLENDDAIN